MFHAKNILKKLVEKQLAFLARRERAPLRTASISAARQPK
jgi:hypothetical protein